VARSAGSTGRGGQRRRIQAWRGGGRAQPAAVRGRVEPAARGGRAQPAALCVRWKHHASQEGAGAQNMWGAANL